MFAWYFDGGVEWKPCFFEKRLFLGAAVISPGRPANVCCPSFPMGSMGLEYLPIGKYSPEPWGRGEYSKLLRHQCVLPTAETWGVLWWMGWETNPRRKACQSDLVWFRDSLLKIYIETERDKSWWVSWNPGCWSIPRVWWIQKCLTSHMCAPHQIAAFPKKNKTTGRVHLGISYKDFFLEVSGHLMLPLVRGSYFCRIHHPPIELLNFHCVRIHESSVPRVK